MPRLFASRCLVLVAGLFSVIASSAADTPADLSDLQLDSVPLSPAFARDGSLYSGSTSFANQLVTLNGTPASAGTATVRTRLNGGISRSGLPLALSLRPGLNRLAVRVTASGSALPDFPLAAGVSRNLALLPGGQLAQWGVAAGDTPAALPVDTQADVTGVFAGSLGQYYLKADGALHTISGGTLPSDLTAGVAGVTEPSVIAAEVGEAIAIALRADGTVRAWGIPIAMHSLGGVVAVAAGYDHVLTLGADGRVSAWGSFSSDHNKLDVPVAARSGVVAIAASRNTNLALKADGSVVQWGEAADTPVPAEAADVVAIAVSGTAKFALTRAGAVIAWGATAALLPPISAAEGVVGLKTGPQHVLALKTDGSIIAWGANGSGAEAVSPTGISPLFTPPLRDYQITVDRVVPSPALASLTSTGGALSPAFAPDTVSYAQTLIYDFAGVDVAAIPVSTSAPSLRFRLNGAPLAASSPATLPLRLGLNQIQLRVTAAGTPLRDFPLAGDSIRNLAVSSAGTVMQGHAVMSGSPLPALPVESQSGVTGVFAGSFGEYAVKADGSLLALSGGAVPAEAQPVSPGTAVLSVAVGNSHALLLRADGSTYAWGSNNTYGQITIPADAQSGVIAIACGANHSLALRADGQVVAWGENTSGQATVPSTRTMGAIAIAARGTSSLALRSDGAVVAWGSATSTPLPASTQSGVVAISVGDTYAYALTQSGAVVIWEKTGGTLISTPAALQSDVIAIAAAPDRLLALKSDGAAEAWHPFHTPGATRQPATFNAPVLDAPARVYHLLVERDGFDSLAALQTAPGSLSPAFAADLETYTLSANTPYRGLALHALPFAKHPRLEIRAGSGGFSPVVAGQTLAYSTNGGVALRANGSVLGWGNPFFLVPTAAQSDVVSVTAGLNHALALKSDGTVVGWGLNSSGQISLPAGLRATAVAAGASFSLVLQPDGKPAVIGATGISALRTIPGDATDLVAISAGSAHAMGLRRDGRVVVWGPSSAVTTVPLDAQSGIVAIAAAGGQCLALRSDGRVVSWGSNTADLGTVPHAAAYGVVAISASPSHAVALKTDGSVVAWGGTIAALPRGHLPDLAAVVAGANDFSGLGVTTAILRDGSLVQIDAPPGGVPAELETGAFAVPFTSLLPLSPGANTVEIRVSSRTTPDTRTYTVSAPRLAAPELSIYPVPGDYPLIDGFGPLSVGYAKVGGAPLVTAWRIVNTGDAGLTVASKTFDGAHAGEFSTLGLELPLTLAPGEEAAFATIATPASPGDRLAALRLSANLPQGVPHLLSLQAEGITADGLLSTWRTSHFNPADLADPSREATVWGDLADPDGDGLANLLEYALDSSPEVASRPPAAALDISNPAAPRLTLTYTRVKRAAAAGIVYRVEWSDTLAADSWSEAGVTESAVPIDVPFNTLETVTASVAADGPRRFLRLRVTAP